MVSVPNADDVTLSLIPTLSLMKLNVFASFRIVGDLGTLSSKSPSLEDMLYRWRSDDIPSPKLH